MRKSGIAILIIILGLNRVIQPSASVVEGVVKDVTGAVIQECGVTLLNEEAGATLSTRTNEDGVYVFPAVQPGVYSLSITTDGFIATCDAKGSPAAGIYSSLGRNS